jgi:hypothetical protein
MRAGRALLAVVLAAVVLVIALRARGGDEEGEQLTHAGLVERANEICARLARENRVLEPPPRPYDEQSADFFAGVHENVVEAKDALDELNPPAADRGALDELVALYSRIDVRLDQVEGSASVEQDPEVLTLFTEIDIDTAAISQLERQLGVCAAGTSARQSVSAVLRRTRPNPLTQTGVLTP